MKRIEQNGNEDEFYHAKLYEDENNIKLTWVFFKKNENPKYETFKIDLKGKDYLKILKKKLNLKDEFEYKFGGGYSDLNFTENSIKYVKENSKIIKIEEFLKKDEKYKMYSKKRKRINNTVNWFVFCKFEGDDKFKCLKFDNKPLMDQIKSQCGESEDSMYQFVEYKELIVSENSLRFVFQQSKDNSVRIFIKKEIINV